MKSIMLYIFDEIEKLTDDFPERCIQHLSFERREKVFSYRFPLDKRLSAAVYLLLRMTLKENYGIDEPVIFSYGKNGKPFLRDYPQIHFNLSHCRSAAVCAVSSGEIGVDAQEIVPVSDDLARRVLTVKEYSAFKNAENPSLLFCEYWVIKESYLKRTGDGIVVDLAAVHVNSIDEKTLFTGGGDYCCCATGTSVPLRRVSVPELSVYTKP